MLYLSIVIQSSVKGAEFLEHRINEFLAHIRAEWDPTDEQVETAKAALINTLKQKKTSLGAEATFNWTCLNTDYTDFDVDVRKIAAVERVTKAQIMACFSKLFFENPRRINFKIHSHAHLADEEAV